MDTTEIMKQCKKFSTCNCNNCPLDKDCSSRTILEDEKKCDLPKKARIEIAEKYGLETGGLKKSEMGAKARFSRMNENQQKKFTSEGSETLKKMKTRLYLKDTIESGVLIPLC